MKVVFTASARKSLRRVPADRRTQIVARIDAVAAGQRADVQSLEGSDLLRLRVGQYRVLFAVDAANQILTVQLVRARGDVYNPRGRIQEVAGMSVLLPKPKSITSEEVVLSRDDWEKLVSALDRGDADKDADDIAAVEAARAEDDLLAARLEAERGCPVEMTIPIEVVRAELDGVHPARAWREYRGWTEDDLARKSVVARKSIEQIESRRTEAGAGPLLRIAKALGIPMEFLVEEADDTVM